MSDIASKNIFADEKTYSLSDYVVDSMTDMWDAENNAGLKKHDSKLRFVKNLVGSVDMSIENGVQALKKSLLTDGSYEPLLISGRWQSYWCEIVFKVKEFRQSGNSYVKLGRYGSVYTSTADQYLINSQEEHPYDAKLQPETLYTLSFGDGEGAYLNGNELSLVNIAKASYSGERDTQSFLNYIAGELFCVRKYSRRLTAEEAQHNFNIDTARFGI